jgi:hypothetical protein
MRLLLAKPEVENSGREIAKVLAARLGAGSSSRRTSIDESIPLLADQVGHFRGGPVHGLRNLRERRDWRDTESADLIDLERG